MAKRLTLLTTTTPRLHQITLIPAHCTIVLVDIKGFCQQHRNNINQARMRKGMYWALEHAFDTAGIPWSPCHREDRGDGVLVLAHATVTKALFVDRLPETLADAVINHNSVHPTEEQMRLRLALHAGEIIYDEHGVTGSSINHTFRILESTALKNSLAESSAVLAVAGSAWFFDEVIRQSESSNVKSYRQMDITSKETSTKVWVRLLGGDTGATNGRTRPRPRRARPPRG